MIYNFKARYEAASNVTNEIVNPEALLQSSVEHNEHRQFPVCAIEPQVLIVPP